MRGLGSCYLNTGQVDRAVAEFRAALRIEPGLVPAQRGLEASQPPPLTRGHLLLSPVFKGEVR